MKREDCLFLHETSQQLSDIIIPYWKFVNIFDWANPRKIEDVRSFFVIYCKSKTLGYKLKNNLRALLNKQLVAYRVCARDIIKFSNPKLKSH